MLKDLIIAICFLTTIPIYTKPAYDDIFPNTSRSGIWYPFVGLIIGVMLVLLDWILQQLFSPFLEAILLVAFWTWLTGALHWDGLSDCYDALLASVPAERRLEILKDPRLGSYGVMGLVLHLLIKIATVISLTRISSLAGIGHVNFSYALLFAPVVARWLILTIALQPKAKNTGMGASFSNEFQIKYVFIAGTLPLLMTILGGWQAAIALVLAIIATVGIAIIARKRLGGITGDVFGLTVEVCEGIILLVYALKIW